MASKEEANILKKAREICLDLPEAVERINGFGHITFQVNKKSFVLLSERAGLAFKSDPETQEILMGQKKFFKTPYIGRHGWVSILNPSKEDWNELAELIREAYLRKAPKWLVEEWMGPQTR